MSGFLGDFAAGKTVRCRFNTVNTSGAPATLAGAAVTIAKDGADVAPSGGVTLTVDAGGEVGRHLVTIDMGVDTATFAAGSEYSVRLAGTPTVAGVSVKGVVVGEWSVQNRYMRGTDGAVTTAPPTAAAIRAEMDASSTRLAHLDADVTSRAAPADVLRTVGHPIAADASGNVSVAGGGSGSAIPLGSGTVQAGATARTVVLSSANMGTGNVSYRGRRLYVPLAAGGYLLTDPAKTHSYATSLHTFTFSKDQAAVPAAGDVADIVGA